ncbi:magnesium transport protein CorA [Rhizocola hellebori]|uniref:Magnesium transport protein CorA n=2 Tax=Rhizocola hellebori TaxID=1392758 RepID=A0A8J3Q912_9ACTN|nr:magnesium and cobalt transport protein CorA [Rhizocola hellebori]GIH05422.1 magnesium transport protein CorA [Rhizocola hellebori]
MAGSHLQSVAHAPAPAGRVVDCAIYADGRRQPGQLSYADAYAEVPRTPGAFVWLGLHEPTAEQMADVAEVFKLDPLAVEDAVTADSRPKIERFGEVTLFVLRTTRYVEHPELTETSEVVETGVIVLFIGERFVITVRHGQLGALGPVRGDLEQEPHRLAHGPWVVAHAICDRLADSYLDVSTAIEVDIDALEEKVFTPRTSSNIAQIYQLKRELMEFKRAVAPLQRPMTTLVEDKTFLPKEIRRYFRNVNDHLQRVVERIAAYDDLCNSILQARLAQVTVDQNNDMRKIAAWAAIAAMQTAIAGIYGMNFDYMPELQTQYGYPAVLTVMLGAALLLHRMFRSSGWL